jgi:hypothetical protein
MEKLSAASSNNPWFCFEQCLQSGAEPKAALLGKAVAHEQQPSRVLGDRRCR